MKRKTIRTIEDIAKLANVSKATVSRALNNSPLVRGETKERIQAIAREHHFRINVPARNLSMRRSNTVAFVTHTYYKGHFSVENQIALEMLGGITDGLYDLGYELLVVQVDPSDSNWASRYLNSSRVDGFILMTSTRKQYHIKVLVEMGAPFIAWGVPSTKYRYCTVTGDNLSGGRLATEHLISIGRQRIAFLGGDQAEAEVQLRFEGYQTALEAASWSVAPELVVYGDYSHASGILAMQQLFEQAPDLDAVFVNSDVMALAAINVIQNRGKHVPEDVAVVGYDDIAIAAYNNLPLTTIRQNIHLAGKLLAQNLIQYVKSGVVTNVTIPVELVVRKSA
ncbi:MAG: LacI family DNA-binding transcriptional regulator [Anaerolineales bacterium]